MSKKSAKNIAANISLLKEPFKKRGSVVFAFCGGCGALTERGAAGARDLSIAAGMEGPELPEVFTEEYFETDGCNACNGNNGTVLLKNIA